MMIVNKNLPVVVKQAVDDSLQRIKNLAKQLWLRVAFFILIVLVLTQKEFSFQFTIGNGTAQQTASVVETPPPSQTPQNTVAPYATTVSSTTASKDKKWWETIRDESKDIRSQMNLANAATAVGSALTEEQKKKAAQYSNLGFILNPNFAKKHNVDPQIVAVKNKICTDYIAKYSVTAKEEADLFNIPASITLAQGLLESNAGKSSLAAKENNHFGIKCRKKCLGCRCANYTDDSRYDMFRIFDSAWESFREHSKLLSNTRYKHLSKLKRTDYKNWAHGLQAAGYATDKRYASKLIAIIEALNLDRFDK
ncbi:MULTISPECIES: glycoside hydrolase family 73 protein [unclassified Aureispira]|uniref:glycoside hydrolase family 73 protein n=1 Tax=unclassified Aureispira TaxID=2649989 RepID=UPI001E634057|nr:MULTISPECIES: glucosaminidase domain-containing protein [unclassified Aureispira]WMX15383.1 glucosaminidase domain-containing protein [Aureispira sp. CCB-E]